MTNVDRVWPYDASGTDTRRVHGRGHVLIAEHFAAGDLARLRTDCRSILRGISLDDQRASMLVYAINECLTNVIRHGGGQGWFAFIYDRERLVALVTDHGPGGSMPIPDQLPANDSLNGRGLWMARQMVDDMTLTTGSSGTTVRLQLAHPSPDGHRSGGPSEDTESSLAALRFRRE